MSGRDDSGSPTPSVSIRSKPSLLWAFWRDELSIALEKTFSIHYVEPVAGASPLINHSLPEMLDSIGQNGPRPTLFFLHAWILCDSLLGLAEIGIPSVAYFHDAHFHLNSWMWDLSQCFDWVLMDTRESEEYFVRRGSARTVTYCPVYYKGSKDSASAFRPSRPRPLDVAFVGNMTDRLHPGRTRFFQSLTDRLGRRYRLHFGPGEYEKIYPEAKVVINESVPPPLDGTGRRVYDAANFRVFEAMACGSMLLCDSPPPSVRALFEVGRDLVGYEHANVDDAVTKVEHYLARRDERIAIAERGWRSVIDHHTPEARAEAIAPILAGVQRASAAPQAPDTRFLLGRSILRQGIALRRKMQSAGHPVLTERMGYARKLLGAGLRSARYGPMAASLLPLFTYLEGHTREAIEEWKRLKGTSSHAFASAFLFNCARGDGSLWSEAGSLGLAPSDSPILPPEEMEVLREILEGSILQPSPG